MVILAEGFNSPSPFLLENITVRLVSRAAGHKVY